VHPADAKANAAVQFAAKVAKERATSATRHQVVRDGGFTTPSCGIIALVAENSFTNYLNEVAKTEIDFPVVPSRGSAP